MGARFCTLRHAWRIPCEFAFLCCLQTAWHEASLHLCLEPGMQHEHPCLKGDLASTDAVTHMDATESGSCHVILTKDFQQQG